jgi:hypothetical protein
MISVPRLTKCFRRSFRALRGPDRTACAAGIDLALLATASRCRIRGCSDWESYIWIARHITGPGSRPPAGSHRLRWITTPGHPGARPADAISSDYVRRDIGHRPPTSTRQPVTGVNLPVHNLDIDVSCGHPLGGEFTRNRPARARQAMRLIINQSTLYTTRRSRRGGAGRARQSSSYSATISCIGRQTSLKMEWDASGP